MMKKVLNIATVVIAFVAFTAMSVAIGEFKFEKETHDFGTIPQNKPASYEFHFTNVGDAPIILASVSPSFQCIVCKRAFYKVLYSKIKYKNTCKKPDNQGCRRIRDQEMVKKLFTSCKELFLCFHFVTLS
jgi:hypothetical protein